MTEDEFEKKIERKSRSFREIWDRTPELNRFIFNEKMDKIRHSCKIIENTIELSKSVKESKESLERTRKINNYIFVIPIIFFLLIDNFTFLQTDSFTKLQTSEKTIIFGLMFIGLLIITYVRDLSGWIDLNSKINKLDILRSIPTYVERSSRFYQYFVVQEREPYDEIKSKEYQIGYISECINLLSKINRETESSGVDLGW